jgi:hypothetical protein
MICKLLVVAVKSMALQSFLFYEIVEMSNYCAYILAFVHTHVKVMDQE